MKFKTLEKYDAEIKDIENILNDMEKYIEKHPSDLGTAGNYDSLKYVYNILKKDQTNFIKQINQINLKLDGNLLQEGLYITELTELSKLFNNTENSTILLKNNLITRENLMIKEISEGSYNITFAFENPTEEYVKRTSPRKKGLMKIFDFINCGDDIEKLKKEAGQNGREALLSYKNFLEVIVKLNADFTLDTELGTVKSGLTLQQCKNICENLNI